MKNSKNNTQQQNYKIIEGTTKVPSVILRKCCGCGKITDRKNLIRILFENKTKNIIINPNNKEFGKSRYLCPNSECLKIATKKKRINLNENLLFELKNYIKN